MKLFVKFLQTYNHIIKIFINFPNVSPVKASSVEWLIVILKSWVRGCVLRRYSHLMVRKHITKWLFFNKNYLSNSQFLLLIC